TTAQSDGVYWIAPYVTNTNDPKALKILKSIDSSGRRTHYYLESRRPIGFDAGLSSNGNVMNGVVVRIRTESSGNSSFLLDMTPETSSWNDPALTVGKTFSDPDAGVTFTVLSADSTGATVSVTFAGGGGPVCVRANPSVSLSPSSQTAGIGSSANYTVTVTNADNSACTASTFNLTSVMPGGLSGSFGSSALSLSPGSSGSTSLQVSSSATAAAGNYNFTATATNSADSSYQKSASGALSLISSLAVSAATDKPSYARNQQVNMSATVTAGGAPMANVNVTFTITKANGSVVTGNSLTGSNGVATYKIRLNKKDPVGSYQLKAVGSMGTVSGTSTTSFMVQ
ncbi:MAG: peptidase M11, partial [Deltaproteobacteria bacterium]|nr:peptidase M11 [Deltaproteobacteria bacterium]